ISPPLGGHEIGQLPRVSRRPPLALAYEQQARSGISRQCAIRNLRDCQIRLGQRTKLIGKDVDDARDCPAVFLRRTRGAGRQVNGNVQAFCLYGEELQGAGDKSPCGFWVIDPKGVRDARARARRRGRSRWQSGTIQSAGELPRDLTGWISVTEHRSRCGGSCAYRCRSFASARADHDEALWHLDVEGAGETVRWVAREGEPAGGQQKIGAIFSDRRQANARDGAVLLIGQNAAVFKR